MLWAVSLLLLLGYSLLIAYYQMYWRRVPVFQPQPAAAPPFISVIIAARNEAAHLPLLLEALNGQTLPTSRFEVIVVDDYSTDNTAAAVRCFLSERVRMIQPIVGANQSSKKKAIEAGVAQAKGSLVVVTDADCLPPPRWLELMTGFYCQKRPAFIVAPVCFTANNTLLGIFQSLDFMMLQGITAASVQAGAHSMCNGANLAYEREAFHQVGGFTGIDARASGDDMLLLYKIWQKQPLRIHYLRHPGAIMPTPAQQSWRSFFRQRIRWSSKATYYQDKRITAVLFFVYGFNCWVGALLITAFFQPQYWIAALTCLATKTAVEMTFLFPVARFFRQQALLWYFPLLQPLHIGYTIAIGLLSRKKSYEWKGRRTQ
ncbi:Glycosyltransferase, catalytic subunit of cellulose synthase and poly-beta-1,6-N-acetylglucosamine synthase [Cnuella takakiae]|uniref:Glycosyltransferase, catalytic subunit of cellulose synthase and poly-beta-1,6-N-acetylglucosamine synthase n=1 Tax=Cnuella takakiae TaxID=1302690 RepID=A0A1M5D017_9BACT|nr:glycosyltransferase [Cnuella takakiae]OLY94150.1 hypothetical protein BUE76_21365 [Cnuella takakiae]SHF60329.1 Glycosyltransferase, catalytic subunit of cellulose synthase and poly-beta-1,6-N-acetylglucosamine synthase [Cnuella takakiae]